jgi:hypothetical protein
LVLALVEEAVRRTAAVAERQMRDAPTPRDAVRAWARVLLALAKAERAPGVQAIALDRYRLLRRFPDADATIGAPLRRPLQQVLERAGQPCPELLTDACFQLVLSRQAAWIAVGHEPMEEELRAYEDLTVRLAGLSD